MPDVEMYCDEFRASLNDGDDPGTLGVENYNTWLEAQGQPAIDLDQETFLQLVRAIGFDPVTLDWVKSNGKKNSNIPPGDWRFFPCC